MAGTITRSLIQQWRSALHPRLMERDWYTVLSAATASAHIGKEACPEIYRLALADHLQHGQTDPNATSSDSEDVPAAEVQIQRRIKESLLKGAVLYGIPSCLESTFAVVEAIRAEERAAGFDKGRDEGFFLRQGQAVADVTARGEEQLQQVYRHNFPDIDAKFGKDMEDTKLLTIPVFYGLILSENRVLDFASTELVILSALIPQNFRNETLWHLRGCRRAGWSDDVIDSVRSVALMVSAWAGRRTDHIPRLDEVSETSNE